MQTEELILDNCSQGKVIEEFSEAFPDVGVAVFSTALIVKSIDLSDLSGLMISSEDGDSVFVSDFESEEEGDGLDGMVTYIGNGDTSVNIVAHKQIV